MKMLKMPITEPSEPLLINLVNIAKGSAKVLAQPIPAIAIKVITRVVFVVNAIAPNAKAIDVNEIAWIILFPNFEDKIPIGNETIKHIRLNIAKHTDEKFVASEMVAS